MTTKFIRYMQRYLELLTDGQKEFFIAIVDIDKSLSEKFLQQKADYAMAWFDRKEYSQAVVLRNDKSISRIVLFSSDSVKMIDSLKDFIEYPAIPEDKNMFWECLSAAFDAKLDKYCKKLLETVMEYRRVSLEEQLSYLDSCVDEKSGNFIFEHMADHLYQLELWTFDKAEKAKNKTKLRKLIRNSDALLAEARLMSGITQKKIDFPPRKRKMILQSLSKNDFRTIFEKVKYDEQMEQLFKGSVRTRKDLPHEKLEEHVYENSYEYAMQVKLKESMEEIEKDFIEDDEKDGRNNDQTENEILQDSMQKFCYQDDQRIEAEFQEITDEMERLSLTNEKKKLLKQQIAEIKQNFLEAKTEGGKCTPACLWNYARSQKKFVKSYFALLGKCIADMGIARMCVGEQFLSRLQNIFCDNEENGLIKMPFYHPLAGFYFIKLQKKYETFRKLLDVQTGEFGEQAVWALIEKERMKFPVRYMLYKEELYQLDYSSLKNMDGYILFERNQENTSGSWVNIRLLNDDLLDYLNRQNYLAEIQVTIVDINDIKEITSMINRLKNFAASEKSMVHKVVLNIVSSKEEELKKQLQENMEIDLDYPQVLFRFAKEKYMNGQQYDMERIIQDSDLLFLADSSLLYQKPRLKEWTSEPNRLIIAFEQFDPGKLPEEEQDQILEVMWDSMHYMEQEQGVKLSFWDTKELNQSLLNLIRKEVRDDPHRTVVILSSNTQLMQHLYHLPEFQMRHSILSGQDMLLVNFHAGSRRKLLKEDGEASVTVPLKSFLEGVTGLDDIKCVLSDENESPEVPYLTVAYRKMKIVFLCTVFVNAQKEEQKCKIHYIDLMKEAVQLLDQSSAFKDEFIAMLYEGADNYQTALMLDYMHRTNSWIEKCGYEYKQEQKKAKTVKSVDAVDVMQFQKMLAFVRERDNITEFDVYTFMKQGLYKKEMLGQCIRVDHQLHLLDQDTLEKIQQLNTKLEEKNG